MNWLRSLFRAACRHEFRYSDLKLTGIPATPIPSDFEGAMEWHRNEYRRAHCGLDVLHHGTPIKA